MVEYVIDLDLVFASLGDATRRDILRRVAKRPHSISALAKPYDMSFAAVAKHVGVLEAACLVKKHRLGKRQIVSVAPKTLTVAAAHLTSYKKVWNARFDALDELLKSN